MKSLKERIAIEQAYLDGKDIEFMVNMEGWEPLYISLDEMIFYWFDNDYRIKPEPMEFWVNVYDVLGSEYLHKSKKDAMHFAGQDCKTIKVQEVKDE